jgi:hypothetical protein
MPAFTAQGRACWRMDRSAGFNLVFLVGYTHHLAFRVRDFLDS